VLLYCAARGIFLEAWHLYLPQKQTQRRPDQTDPVPFSLSRFELRPSSLSELLPSKTVRSASRSYYSISSFYTTIVRSLTLRLGLRLPPVLLCPHLHPQYHQLRSLSFPRGSSRGLYLRSSLVIVSRSLRFNSILEDTFEGAEAGRRQSNIRLETYHNRTSPTCRIRPIPRRQPIHSTLSLTSFRFLKLWTRSTGLAVVKQPSYL
jgi:hypothetical protein